MANSAGVRGARRALPRVVQPFHGRAVTLVLGNRNFQLRYNNFLSMSDQLLEKLPNAVSFDLRLEEQVTAAEEQKPERKHGK